MGKKGKDKEIIKIPVVFDDYKLKRTTGSLLLTFAVPPERLDMAKPLLNYVNQPFILSLKKMEGDIEVYSDMEVPDVKM